jgi:hypothetical protein
MTRVWKDLSAAIVLVFVTTAALAQPQQQPADPVVLQRVIGVLEQQRNFALNAQANAETRVLGLADENEKLKARVKEFEQKEFQSHINIAPPADAKKD